MHIDRTPKEFYDDDDDDDDEDDDDDADDGVDALLYSSIIFSSTSILKGLLKYFFGEKPGSRRLLGPRCQRQPCLPPSTCYLMIVHLSIDLPIHDQASIGASIHHPLTGQAQSSITLSLGGCSSVVCARY